MAIHFFKVPKEYFLVECAEVKTQLEAMLVEIGRENDRVIVTNFDYQGSFEEEEI